MGNKRINIAYFTADLSRELVSVALGAVEEYLEVHKDVYVQVFDCFSHDLYSKAEGFGYQIFDLPDLSQYDAALVQSHQIMDSGVIKKLETRIMNAGIPAISVGARMRGCISIGTDDYSAARELAEHIVKKHHARTFLYLKGCEWEENGGEAERRRKAFEDVCREYGIPAGNISYYDGNWESRRGRRAVEELLESGAILPDAIVSANDEMALGALSGLTEAGVSVPEDVIVSGFDGILSASLSDPRLSTISRDFGTMIKTALDALIALTHKEKVPAHIYSPYKVICSESCGCYENYLEELPKIKRMYYQNAREQERFFYLQDRMTADLFGSESGRMMETVEKHYQIFGEGRVYVFSNERYYEHFYSGDVSEDVDSISFSDTFVMTLCGGRDLKRGENGEYLRFSRKDLIDAPVLRDEQMTIFYSLHFQNINMGFLVLTRPPSVVEMQLHENIVNLCVFAVENARQRLRLRRLNKKLNALYMRDQLTGFYNRFGYDRMAESVFENINSRGGEIHVLFLDIDDMKGINDKYGHDQGDLAIRIVSEIVNSSCRKDDFKMRYGGDEFVIITEAGKTDLRERLAEKFRIINEGKELPFYLGVSIGEYTVEGKSPESLDDLLRHADELMYQEKSRRKRAGRHTS